MAKIEKKIQFNCRNCERVVDISLEQTRSFFPDIDKIMDDIDAKAAEYEKTENKKDIFKGAVAKLYGYCTENDPLDPGAKACYTMAGLQKM